MSKILGHDEALDLLRILHRRVVDEREAMPADQRDRCAALDAREAMIAEHYDALEALPRETPGRCVLVDLPPDLYHDMQDVRGIIHVGE